MDFSEYLNAAKAEESSIEIRYRDQAFTLRLRLCDRMTLDSIRRASVERKPNRRTGGMDEKIDEQKLREQLIAQCVVGWEGVTYAKAARLKGKIPPGTTQDGVPLPFAHAPEVLGSVIGIEDAIWEVCAARAETESTAEASDRGN